MKRIKTKNGEVIIYADTIEYEAYNQIKEIANLAIYENANIKIMPDCHAGKGCVIGTTMRIKNKVTPNIIGVDIGCGLYVVKLKEKNINSKKLDDVINNFIPSGHNIHNKPQVDFNFDDLKSQKHLDLKRALYSIGSLGGGNHFIEIDKNDNDELYLVIHSGSRYLGLQIAKYYQNLAWKYLNEMSSKRSILIDKLKREGRETEISTELKKLKKEPIKKDLAYVEGETFDNYVNDLIIAQLYASLNRQTMAKIILDKMNLHKKDSFETIHNYLDGYRMIVRKGAVRAEKGERLIIPINMRDGSLICIGKGNPDWNYSAPHGAGRLMSRSKAKQLIDLKTYKKQMRDIYSTSININTIDEAPDVYKSKNEIVNLIKDTVDIIEEIKPIYNFKAH